MDTRPTRLPGSDLVGRRISVRHLDPTGSATDVVGRVLSVDNGLRMERRDGSLATVDPATIVVWRLVPDRPVRSRRPTAAPVDQLARIMARGWPAIEVLPVAGWDLRASGGFTKRANSAAALAEPEGSVEAALDAVAGFYEQRELRPLVQVESDTALERRIVEAGWRVVDGGDALVLVAQLDRRWPADPEVELASHADDAWIADYRSTPDPEVARRVLEAPSTVAFSRLGPAVARTVVTGEWAGLSALAVPEAQRRTGLGRRLVAAGLGWAVEQGADKAYLQVEADNEPALALYRQFGFVEHHGYRYLAPSDLTRPAEAGAGAGRS